jgi:hypothetical protein
LAHPRNPESRQAAAQAILGANRNKAFDQTAFIGLAVNGTSGGQARAFDVTLDGISVGTNRSSYMSQIGYNSPSL